MKVIFPQNIASSFTSLIMYVIGVLFLIMYKSAAKIAHLIKNIILVLDNLDRTNSLLYNH